MAVKDDRQTGRPVEIGGDAIAVVAKEDLLGGHAAQVDGDVVEMELLPAVFELASLHDGATVFLGDPGFRSCRYAKGAPPRKGNWPFTPRASHRRRRPADTAGFIHYGWHCPLSASGKHTKCPKSCICFF